MMVININKDGDRKYFFVSKNHFEDFCRFLGRRDSMNIFPSLKECRNFLRKRSNLLPAPAFSSFVVASRKDGNNFYFWSTDIKDDVKFFVDGSYEDLIQRVRDLIVKSFIKGVWGWHLGYKDWNECEEIFKNGPWDEEVPLEEVNWFDYVESLNAAIFSAFM